MQDLTPMSSNVIPVRGVDSGQAAELVIDVLVGAPGVAGADFFSLANVTNLAVAQAVVAVVVLADLGGACEVGQAGQGVVGVVAVLGLGAVGVEFLQQAATGIIGEDDVVVAGGYSCIILAFQAHGAGRGSY